MEKRCIVITAYIEGKIRDLIRFTPDDLIVCADGGYQRAMAEGIQPHVLIGDFDSFDGNPENIVPDDVDIIRQPVEKDDTDTLLCLKFGLNQGCEEFILIGGIGGRFDHTIGNLQSMAFIARKGKTAKIFEKNNMIVFLGEGEMRVKRVEGWKMSLLAFSDKCEGISERGVYYPLDNVVLTNDFPIGVSNVITEEEAVITNGSGLVMVMMTRD